MIVHRTQIAHQQVLLRVDMDSKCVHMHIGDDRQQILNDAIPFSSLQARVFGMRLIELAKSLEDQHA